MASGVDLAPFAALVPLDHGLCVVTTLRSDGSAAASVVNAGEMDHPVAAGPVVAFVSAGRARRLAHLRTDPRITVTIRAGWQWAAVEGTAEVIGPDDARGDVDAEALRLMLRAVFVAAGGTHDDWDTYDRVMRDERRAAVLIDPSRVYSNPAG
jgi:PPOX class probable F420-dependent enzyme